MGCICCVFFIDNASHISLLSFLALRIIIGITIVTLLCRRLINATDENAITTLCSLMVIMLTRGTQHDMMNNNDNDYCVLYTICHSCSQTTTTVDAQSSKPRLGGSSGFLEPRRRLPQFLCHRTLVEIELAHLCRSALRFLVRMRHAYAMPCPVKHLQIVRIVPYG